MNGAEARRRPDAARGARQLSRSWGSGVGASSSGSSRRARQFFVRSMHAACRVRAAFRGLAGGDTRGRCQLAPRPPPSLLLLPPPSGGEGQALLQTCKVAARGARCTHHNCRRGAALNPAVPVSPWGGPGGQPPTPRRFFRAAADRADLVGGGGGRGAPGHGPAHSAAFFLIPVSSSLPRFSLAFLPRFSSFLPRFSFGSPCQEVNSGYLGPARRPSRAKRDAAPGPGRLALEAAGEKRKPTRHPRRVEVF